MLPRRYGLAAFLFASLSIAHSVAAFPTPPPTVAIASPLPGAGVVGGAVAVRASLSSSAGVTDVEFFVDGASIGVDTSAPYLVGWNTAAAANGSHSLTAVAHDGLGGAVTSPAVLLSSINPAFTDEVVVPGITAAVTMAFLPDGRMLVGELTEKIWVVQPGASVKDATPFLSLDGSLLNGEQGLMDIAIDPNFATNGYYYVYWTRCIPGQSRNRVSRFTASGNTTNPATEFLLWSDDRQANLEHHGGSLQFGNDGKLYISTGEEFHADESPDLTTYRGKVLRVNLDGTIPLDNPFADGAGPNKDEIWARGLRNPFRGSIDPVTGRFYLGDVGGNDPSTAFEEVNLVTAGANFGWPTCEGPCPLPGITSPLFAYPHNGRDAAITGGFVYRGTQFPAEYYGSYFFGDYVQNTIKRLVLDPAGNLLGVVNFIPPDGTPDGTTGDIAKLLQGPDGALYYVDVGFNNQHTPNDAAIRRVRWTVSNQPPVAAASGSPLSGGPPLTVNFSSAGSFDPEGGPLTYAWSFGDGGTSTQANPSHTYANAGPYVARLTVSDGVSTMLSSDLNITVGTPPTAEILSPPDGLPFQGGDLIPFAGSGSDAEDGILAANRFSWTIVFHHDTHVHPGGGPFPNVTSGVFPIPTSGHDFSGATSYEIILTVTDSSGLSASDSVFIYPDKVNLVFQANPTGLGVDIDSIRRSTPFVKDTVTNFQHVIGAPSQSFGGSTYNFSSWSDGGAASHTIVVPPGGMSYTATFAPVGTPGLVAAFAFEEPSGSTTADASSSGLVGNLLGGTARTASGKYGSALLFNGSNARVSVPDAPPLDLTTAMTLEAWVYPTAGGSQWRDVIHKESDSYYLEATGTQLGKPGFGGDFSAQGPLIGPSPLPLNTWTHLAGTYDGATFRMYVNGAQVTSRAQTGAMVPTAQALGLGGNGVSGQYFTGRIDEVRVYSRALSLAEIQSDMVLAIDPAFRDSDADGVLDGADNCPQVANLAQTNSDGFFAGDACQCGDVDANGSANPDDVPLLRAALAGIPPGLTAAGTNRCPVIAPATACDVLDLSVLRRALAAKPPGIAQVCPAQFAP